MPTSIPELGARRRYSSSSAYERTIRSWTLNLDNNPFHVLNGQGEWTSLNAETTGTAVGEGNGVTQVYTIAHGLVDGNGEGMIPYCCFVQVSSSDGCDLPIWWDYDENYIIVTFKTQAPPPGVDNLKFQWRAVAP